jgi:hypothetical protein
MTKKVKTKSKSKSKAKPKAKKKIQPENPQVRYLNVLIEYTERNIKGDKSSMDDLFIRQLDRLHRQLADALIG